MAFRHYCPNADRSGSHRCPGGDGRPGKGPKRCPGCGGALAVEQGTYCVFRWAPDGRYVYGLHLPASKPRDFHSSGAAGGYAEELNRPAAGIDLPPGGYVVRFIRT